MHCLTAADAIRIWESSHRRPPAARVFGVLAAAFPDQNYAELRQLTLGQCNRRLLAAREHVFGSHLNASSKCAHCGARFEFSLSTQAFQHALRDETFDQEFDLKSDRYRVRFRLLNLEDLNFASRGGSVAAARQRLVKRCVIKALRANRIVTAEELPDKVISDLAARLSECDPEAELFIDLSCPACEFELHLPFDIGSFFCVELDAEAQRLLREIHVLARGYGWREADILEMSATRRQFYLDLLDQ